MPPWSGTTGPTEQHDHGRDQHGVLTTAVSIIPEKLDSAQTGAVMFWLREPVGAMDVRQCQYAIKNQLPHDPVNTYHLALEQSGISYFTL